MMSKSMEHTMRLSQQMLEVSHSCSRKFRAKIDGKWHHVYYIDTPLKDVLKIDGAHLYFWERDPRITEVKPK